MKSKSFCFILLMMLPSVAFTYTGKLKPRTDSPPFSTNHYNLSEDLSIIIADFRTNIATKVKSAKPESFKFSSSVFAEFLRRFATEGPQTNVVYQYVKSHDGPLTMRDVARGAYQPIEKYSEQEVKEGILRNVSAHKAIWEHINENLAEGGEQEQCGFLRFAILTWGKDRNNRLGDRVKLDALNNFDEVLVRIMNNEKLAPATRINAACYLKKANEYPVNTVLRNIVLNLPSTIPSAELSRSLQCVRSFIPEIAEKIKTIKENETIQYPNF